MGVQVSAAGTEEELSRGTWAAERLLAKPESGAIEAELHAGSADFG
jgi:hypothetical protein